MYYPFQSPHVRVLGPPTLMAALPFTIQGSEGHIHITPNGPVVDYLQTDLQPGVYHCI